MAKYKVIFPFVDDMGSLQAIIVKRSCLETERAQALWYLNTMRKHDNLEPLKRLPNGTKLEKVGQ